MQGFIVKYCVYLSFFIETKLIKSDNNFMIKKTTHVGKSKALMGAIPTIRFTHPEYVFIATTNARCPKAELFIKEGDYVKLYQKIGVRHGPFFDQPIHSTVSGTFVGLEKHYHRSGKEVDFIKIKNDKKNTSDDAVYERTEDEIFNLSKEEITEIVKDTANVGLGGSSFPTYVKFNTDKKIDVLLVNGIECEPYITADHRLMLEYPNRVINGIRYTMHAFNCPKAYICIKSKYKDIAMVYNELLKGYPNIEIKLVKNYYPQGWEIAMIKEALGIEVQSGHLPSEYGIINFNVSTMVGIYKALRYNMPVVKRNITITGDGIVQPKNFRVVVGTPLSDLIPLCGGYKNEDKDKVFIMGGPMMGASVPSDDVIITKTVTSIIVLDKIDYKEEPCVRCGSCVLSCPVHLKPVEIMNAVKVRDRQLVKDLTPLKCIECGLCTYSCTSRINVTDWVRKGKVLAKL